MICTGNVPPQLIMGMELYQLYMQGMMNYWQLWATMTGVNQWTAYMNKHQDSE